MNPSSTPNPLSVMQLRAVAAALAHLPPPAVQNESDGGAVVFLQMDQRLRRISRALNSDANSNQVAALGSLLLPSPLPPQPATGASRKRKARSAAPPPISTGPEWRLHSEDGPALYDAASVHQRLVEDGFHELTAGGPIPPFRLLLVEAHQQLRRNPRQCDVGKEFVSVTLSLHNGDAVTTLPPIPFKVWLHATTHNGKRIKTGAGAAAAAAADQRHAIPNADASPSDAPGATGLWDERRECARLVLRNFVAFNQADVDWTAVVQSVFVGRPVYCEPERVGVRGGVATLFFRDDTVAPHVGYQMSLWMRRRTSELHSPTAPPSLHGHHNSSAAAAAAATTQQDDMAGLKVAMHPALEGRQKKRKKGKFVLQIS